MFNGSATLSLASYGSGLFVETEVAVFVRALDQTRENKSY
jgi:hypothetical protein